MTTSIDWPATLPQQFLIDGYSEKPDDNIIRTSFDAAIATERPRYSFPTEHITGSMIMSSAQLATFKNFFKTTLSNGSAEFNMPIVGDISTTQVVRFTEPYEASSNGTKWVISMTLEVIP